LPKAFLRHLALSQVASDFEKPGQFALIRAKGRDDNVSPELRAVLADSPAFVLKPAIERGSAKLFGRPASADCVRGVKDFDRFPDDLVGRVSFEISRAGVPTLNLAVDVQQEDGVVLHSGHEMAEVLFRSAQGHALDIAVLGISIRRHMGPSLRRDKLQGRLLPSITRIAFSGTMSAKNTAGATTRRKSPK